MYEYMDQQQIHIRASDADLKGVYSNVAQVGHSKEDFRFDFFNMHNQAEWMLVSRIFLSPGHAKRLLAALQDQMSQYESQFGTVTPSEEPKSKMGFKVN